MKVICSIAQRAMPPHVATKLTVIAANPVPVRRIWVPPESIILAGLGVLASYSKEAMALDAMLPPPDPASQIKFGRLFGVGTTLVGVAAALTDAIDMETRKNATVAHPARDSANAPLAQAGQQDLDG